MNERLLRGLLPALIACSAGCTARTSGSLTRSDSLRSSQMDIGTPAMRVEIAVRRFDGQSGPVTVSNGIPLIPGSVTAQDLPKVRLRIGGVDQRIHVEGLGRPRGDGSFRSLLVQFTLPALDPASPPKGELLLGQAKRDAALDLPRQPAHGLIAAAALPTSPDYLVKTKLAGPLVTLARTPVSPDFIGQLNQAYDSYGTAVDASITVPGYRGTATYDFALEHYQQWMRTGDARWFAEANRQMDFYVRTALELNGGFSEWSGNPHNMGIHYFLSGDSDTFTALGKMTEFGLWGMEAQGALYEQSGDWRAMARGIEIELQCWIAACNPGHDYRYPLDNPAGDYDLPRALDKIPDAIVPMQSADGSFRGAPGMLHGGEQKNYQAGMLMMAMIDYIEEYKPEPRFIEAMKKQSDFLWNTQWDPVTQGLPYCSTQLPGVTSNSGDDCVSDSTFGQLNSFHLTEHGYLYALTGDVKYRQRGDALAKGLLTNASMWTGSKFLDESFERTFNYFAWREGILR